jgi:hypothetical protein
MLTTRVVKTSIRRQRHTAGHNAHRRQTRLYDQHETRTSDSNHQNRLMQQDIAATNSQSPSVIAKAIKTDTGEATRALTLEDKAKDEVQDGVLILTTTDIQIKREKARTKENQLHVEEAPTGSHVAPSMHL